MAATRKQKRTNLLLPLLWPKLDCSQWADSQIIHKTQNVCQSKHGRGRHILLTRTAWFIRSGYSSSVASNPKSGSSDFFFFSNFRFVSLVRESRNVSCFVRIAGPSGPGISQHTTKQAKLCFKPRTFSFSISPSTVSPFCLYYCPLCSSSSLSLSICVGVSLISTLTFGAPPIVIVWALTIPVSIILLLG